MRRLWWIIGLCLVLVFCLVPVGMCGVVSYWFVAQDLDDQALRENYEKIKPGMTLGQVEEILGPPIQDMSDPFHYGTLKVLKWENPRRPIRVTTILVVVKFKAGRVVDKDIISIDL
jgi:hypothetical protein